MGTVRDNIESKEECDTQTAETDTVHLRMKDPRTERSVVVRTQFHIPPPAPWQPTRPTTKSISGTIDFITMDNLCHNVTRVSILVVIVRISRH